MVFNWNYSQTSLSLPLEVTVAVRRRAIFWVVLACDLLSLLVWLSTYSQPQPVARSAGITVTAIYTFSHHCLFVAFLSLEWTVKLVSSYRLLFHPGDWWLVNLRVAFQVRQCLFCFIVKGFWVEKLNSHLFLVFADTQQSTTLPSQVQLNNSLEGMYNSEFYY